MLEAKLVRIIYLQNQIHAKNKVEKSIHLKKCLRWLVLNAPLFKHATTSNSGAQLLYSCIALACLKEILSQNVEDFALALHTK